jgi:hypothetical protein
MSMIALTIPGLPAQERDHQRVTDAVTALDGVEQVSSTSPR